MENATINAEATTADLPIFNVPVVRATPENFAPYGLYLGSEVPESGLSIPFYKGEVQEGHNFKFEYRDQAVMRSAKIGRRNPQLKWLERHLNLTQLFVPLGRSGYVMVLAPANHAEGRDLPDLEQMKAFVFEPGVGILLHLGTWHDFPFPVGDSVTVLTANSAEVVRALAACPDPREMLHEGDVYKIDLTARTGRRVVVDIPEAV